MKRKNFPIGKTYGKLLVLEEIAIPFNSTQKNRKTLLHLKCRCECGQIVTPFKGNVLYGKTTSCKYCQNAHIKNGQKHGSLTVISRDTSMKLSKYVCRCDCGFEDKYSPAFFKKAKKLCCKRCRYPKKYEPQEVKKNRKESMAHTNYLKHLKAKRDLIGKKSGRLKIISFSHWEQKASRRRPYYNAKCKCGNMVKIRDVSAIKSCGCLHKDAIPRGEDQPAAKLTNSQVKAIREFKNSGLGYTGRQLGEMFGVTEQVISGILNDKTYKKI